LPTGPGLGFEIDEVATQRQIAYSEELGGAHYYETDGSVRICDGGAHRIESKAIKTTVLCAP